jgi:hypothetical protein
VTQNITMTKTDTAIDTDGARIVFGPAGRKYHAPQHLADQLIKQGSVTVVSPKKRKGGNDGSHQ